MGITKNPLYNKYTDLVGCEFHEYNIDLVLNYYQTVFIAFSFHIILIIIIYIVFIKLI